MSDAQEKRILIPWDDQPANSLAIPISYTDAVHFVISLRQWMRLHDGEDLVVLTREQVSGMISVIDALSDDE